MTHQILLFYKYVDIDDPEVFMKQQKELCAELGITGRMIIAREGLNATFEGTTEATNEYISRLITDARFSDIKFKKSFGTGDAFPKLSIKIRNEIVTLGLGKDDFSPNDTTGTYLPAEQLHQWFQEKKEFYIVDMRNDYEYAVGKFKDSVLPGMKNFRDLPEVLPRLEHLKNKTIVTVCTGGIRCEKASGFLIKNGFNHVYQLQDGIVTYMEKYPNEDFEGKLYVFDGRITMGFNTDSKKHKVIGACYLCGAESDNYINCSYDICHKHIICCIDCRGDEPTKFCSTECEEKAKVHV